MVDAEFKARTGCPEIIGEPIRVTREFVAEAVEVIGRLTSSIQQAVEQVAT